MNDRILYEEACLLAQYQGYGNYKDYRAAVERIYRDLLERKEANNG